MERLREQEPGMTPQEYARRAAAVVRDLQQQWARGAREDEERWGAALRLDPATADENQLIIRFTEPDGRRINYRRLLRDSDGYDALADPEKALRNLCTGFEEDVVTGERSDPESRGVRWFGDRPGEDD
jgi:hypothetical protein